MRRFLLKTLLAVLAAAALHAIAGFFADGRTDDAYLRFTGPRRSSMILGTSRAAQGLKPEVLDRFVSGSEGPFFNFAFTIVHSPYGPSYRKAIEGKLDASTTRGVYILSVDPWSLCERVDRKGRALPMQETKHSLVEQWTYTGEPNYEYLARHMQSGWGSLIGGPLKPGSDLALLHDDGWLEIGVSLNVDSVADRTIKKIAYFREVQLPRNRPSAQRLDALESTIELLRSHGEVAMVRLPVCDSILAIEDQVWPGFEQRMGQLAAKHGVPYWSLMPERDLYTYTDGNHIDRIAATQVSMDLGRRLARELSKLSEDTR